MPTAKQQQKSAEEERSDAAHHARNDFDAVVVGAGPAGLGAAARLVSAGLAVLLLDNGDNVSTTAKTITTLECFSAPEDDPSPMLGGQKVTERVVNGVVDTLDFDGWFRTLAVAFPAQRDALRALFLEIYASRRVVSALRAGEDDVLASVPATGESAAELWSRHGVHCAELRAVLAADCFAALGAPPTACSALAWMAAATLAHDRSVLSLCNVQTAAAITDFMRRSGSFRPHTRVQRVLLGVDGEDVLGVELTDGSVIECTHLVLAVSQSEAARLAPTALLSHNTAATGFAWATVQMHIANADPALRQGQVIMLSNISGAFSLEDWGERCASAASAHAAASAAPLLTATIRLPDGTALLQVSAPIAASVGNGLSVNFDAEAVREALVHRVDDAFGGVASKATVTLLPLRFTDARAQGLASHGQKTAVRGLYVAGSWTTPGFGGIDGVHTAGVWAAHALLADRAHDLEMATVASDLHLQRVLNKPNAIGRADERPLAIVGLSCRFPGGAHSAEEFWVMLSNGHDGVCTVPAGRWDAQYFAHPGGGRDLSGKMCCSRGGFVDVAEVYGFEPSFFGISAREAQQMDAQQRLLLRVCWEAVEDAGVAHEWCHHAKDVGVVVGASSTDDAQLRFNERHRITTHTNVGSASSILANRISYAFDLRGPSFVVDTACSSSLVALTAARDAMLRSGPWGCSAAIIAGVNVLERPEVSVGFSKLGVLGAEGVCRAFDAAASGYVRGEGCGAVVLARWPDTQSQKLRPYALLRGAGVNSDGHAVTGIFNPSAKSQATLMRSVYQRCGVRPVDVAYVEAHGTGTPVGDPVEMRAIGAVFGTDRLRNQPVLVGSVKSNIGHLEPASGIAGLIKTCLALSRNREPLPPTLHLKTPNPAVDWQGLRVQPFAKPTEWPAYARRPLLAAVNSFGFGGTNGHAVLEALPDHDSAIDTDDGEAQLVVVTAKTDASLRGCAAKLGAYLAASYNAYNETLRDVAFTTTCHRVQHELSLACVAHSRAEAGAALSEWARSEGAHCPAGMITAKAVFSDAEPAPSITLIFSGQGSQYAEMARSLLTAKDTAPCSAAAVFTTAVREVDGLLRAEHNVWKAAGHDDMDETDGTSIEAEILLNGTQSKLADRIDLTQRAIFAVQIGLLRVLQAAGVKPAFALGHSLGEVAAAHAAGCLTLQQAVSVIYHRSRLQQRTRTLGGRMAAANLSLAAAYLAIARHPEICISAWTSTTQVTFSGPGEKIEALVAELKKEGVRCTMVKVPSAFHSSQMDSIGDELRSCLAGLHPTPCHVAAVATGCRFCSSVHDDDKALLLDASYWWQNVRRRVSFAPAVTRLAKHGCKVFIEVSPQPVLRSSLVELAGSNAVVLSTLRSGKDDRTCLLELAFQLKATRALPSLDWTPFIARAASKREPQLARLPPYSWSNTEFHAAQSVTASEERLGPQVPHPMVRARQDTPSPSWATDVDTAHIPWVLDHRLQGNIVLPGVTYLDTLAAAGTRLLDGKPFELADITFRNAFYLEPETVYRYVVEAAPLVGEDGCWHMSINSRPEPSGEWTLHCTATLHALREAPSSEAIASIETALAAAVPRCTVPMDMETFFGGLWDDGLQLGHSFRCIRELNVAADNTTSSGIIMPRETLAENELLAWNLLHPAVFDSCLQAALGMRTKRSPFFPVHVNRLRIFRSPIAFAHTSHRPIRVRSLGCVSKLAKGEQMSEQEQRCDLIFADAETGTPFIQIDALSLRYLQSDDDLASREWYSIRWVPTAPFTGMPLAIDSVKRSSTSAEQLIASLKTKAEQVFATVLPCAIGTDGATMGTLCRTYAEQCLANLGVCPSSLSAEGFSAEEACKVAGVIPDYTLYFCRMLRMLSEGDNSLLEALSAASTGTTASPLLASRFRFRAHRDTSKANRMAQQQQEIMQHNPDVWSLMTLLDRCGPELHNLLRGTGQHTAIDLLFHDTVINSLYSDVKQFRNFSVATQVALSEFARLHPGPLRVLEIGAGTGGTTGLLLPVLDPRCTTYHFTDVSSTLVSQARDAIGPRYPFVTFETLDIEQAPPQSMHGTYDVVVAANVLHATRNLHTTMTNVSALLRPGGLCLMMEVENSTWAHFLFGLARGWWLFQDSPLRVDGPLLSADKWRNVMLGAGFADVGAVVYKEKLHESVMNLVIGVTNDNAPPMPVPNAEPLPRVLWVQADPAGMEGARLLSAAQAHFRDQLSLLYVHYDSVSTGRASEHHIGLSRAEFDAALAKYQSEHGGNAPEIIVHATAASTAMLAELSPDVPSAAVLERTQKDSGSLLLLAQAIDSLGSAWSSTRLWVVTRASKADPSGILDPGFNPAGAAVTGFGRILEIENVHVRLSQIDLSAHPSSLELANLCNLLGSSSSKDTSPVAEYSLRDCRRYMSKLERHTGTQTAPRLQAFETVGAGVASPMTFRAAVQRVGGYSMPGHVALLETAQRQLPSGHVRVRVVASGVNFRDLMLLSGKLPRDSTLRTLFAAELGLEFSGVVEEIAPDVKNVAYRVGDSVFGFACNCISSHVVAPASFVVRVPKGLTMEEAAGLPIAFCTAYIALHKLGHVQRGERVLIHAASGGTGLAAARLAKLAGCTVVGTASSEYKRNYLLKSGAADVVLDSRSTSFESGIASLPDGGGVDVVVNSLRGELLEASLRCMRPGGRFVELGKADVYEGTRLSMRLFQDNASFAAFSIDRMMIDNPAEVADTLANVAALFEQGKLQPLPIHVRPICDTEATIRLMGQARHIGKIVLSVRGPTPIVLRCVPLSSSARRSTLRQVRKDGAYVVTGGTSGLGLAIVEHLHRSGAGAVIAVSRSGGDDEAAKKIAALGPSVKTLRIDVSRCTVQEFADAVSNAAGGLPVRGAVHAAMMLRDELVNKMSWPADIESVLGPKVAGAWSVAMAFRQSLDWMITLSSVNSSVGTQGQANYAAGNAFLDALPAFLGSHGVPCFTFNVGPVEDTGFVSRNTAVRGILRDYGYRPVKSAEVISAIFERAMRVSGRWVLNNDALQEAPLATSLGLFEADWPVLFKAVTEFRGVGRLRAIREALEAAASSSGGATQGNAAQPFSIAALAAKGIEAATKELVPRVIEIVSRVLSLPIDRVDPQRPLSQLGLDSLISVELKRELLDRLGADVPIVDLVKGPCISELVASICKTETAKARTQPATVAPTTPTPTATATATATHEQPERQPTPTDNKDLALSNGAASTQATTAATTTKAKSEKGSMIRLCEQDTAGSADIECKALVFGFPRINGSEKVFEGWGKQLPEGCKLVIVVSPNIDTHGDMRMAVDVLADKLRQFYDEGGYRKHNTPVFFFGHCLGCFLAYQTAWLLSNGPHAMPVHGLCVVACPAPSRGSIDDLPAGVSAGFFTEEALEILGKRAAERPLAVPLLAVSGSEDIVVAPHDRVAEWAKLTRAKSIVRQIRGPHNLVTTAPSLLLEMLAEFVATNTATKQMEF